jgi:uncharacterized membrane protein YgdD (TMEM256/DUF423 family)
MNRTIIITASFLGALAVILGAFGAHALKAVLNVQQIETWQTAVQYHFVHALAILFLSTFSRFRNNLILAAYYCFSLGILLFSGSLYFLATRELSGWGFVSVLGPVTPIGGILFIIGWFTLAFAALRNK